MSAAAWAATATVSCASAALAPGVVLAARTAALSPIRSGAARLVLLAVVLATFGGLASARLGVDAALVALLVLAPAGAAAIVDAHERRLPDLLTLPLAILIAAAAGISTPILELAPGMRVLGSMVGGGVLALVGLATRPASVGWGDVKLAPSLVGLLAWRGWTAVYVGLLAWCLLVFVTALLLVARGQRRAIVPYGPAMVIGTAGAIVVTA